MRLKLLAAVGTALLASSCSKAEPKKTSYAPPQETVSAHDGLIHLKEAIGYQLELENIKDVKAKNEKLAHEGRDFRFSVDPGRVQRAFFPIILEIRGISDNIDVKFAYTFINSIKKDLEKIKGLNFSTQNGLPITVFLSTNNKIALQQSLSLRERNRQLKPEMICSLNIIEQEKICSEAGRKKLLERSFHVDTVPTLIMVGDPHCWNELNERIPCKEAETVADHYIKSYDFNQSPILLDGSVNANYFERPRPCITISQNLNLNGGSGVDRIIPGPLIIYIQTPENGRMSPSNFACLSNALLAHLGFQNQPTTFPTARLNNSKQTKPNGSNLPYSAYDRKALELIYEGFVGTETTKVALINQIERQLAIQEKPQ